MVQAKCFGAWVLSDKYIGVILINGAICLHYLVGKKTARQTKWPLKMWYIKVVIFWGAVQIECEWPSKESLNDINEENFWSFN